MKDLKSIANAVLTAHTLVSDYIDTHKQEFEDYQANTSNCPTMRDMVALYSHLEDALWEIDLIAQRENISLNNR